MKRKYTLITLLLISTSVNAQKYWKSSSINVGTTNTLLHVHFVNNNQGFASGKGGILLSTYNGGKTWEIEREEGGTDYNSFITNGERLFVTSEFTKSNYSKDSGNTWFPMETNEEKQYLFNDVSMFGNTMVAVGASVVGLNPVIFTSTNFIKWEKSSANIESGALIRSVFMLDGINGMMITGDKGRYYRTYNSGKDWEVVYGQGLDNDDLLNEIYFTNNDTGYITSVNGNIYSTVNGGLYWDKQSLTDEILNKIVFYNNKLGAVGTTSGVFITEDAGKTWNLFKTETSIRSVYFKDSTTLTAVGGFGKFYTFKPDGLLTVNHIKKEADILIKSNPIRVGDDINLTVSDGYFDAIVIYNMQGKLIYKEDFLTTHLNEYAINTEAWRKGLYIVTVKVTSYTFKSYKVVLY